MTTGEGHDLGATEAPEFHVPRLLRAAEVLCADGRVLRGRVFLPASAESHAGAMRAEEWMNDEAAFFPFLPDGEGRPIILNKAQVVVVTVAASADHDETLEQVGPPVKRVRVECGALRVEGDVLVDMPAQPVAHPGPPQPPRRVPERARGRAAPPRPEVRDHPRERARRRLEAAAIAARAMAAAGETALLVGLSLGGRDRARTESSLEELALLARSAGARVVGTLVQERARRDPATLIGRGKVEEVRHLCEESEADARLLRRGPRAGPAAQPRACGGPEDPRPHAAHPRHLRPPRAHAGGSPAGRARAARLPAAAAVRQGRPPVAARGRHRHEGPRRDEARDRPAAHPAAHPVDPARDRARAARAADAPGGAGAPRGARWWPWWATRTPASRRSSTR